MEMILKPQMMCLTNALNYLRNWSLIFQEPVLTGRIGKKTPGRVRPIIVRFTTWRHCTMVYRKRKDCVNCRITLDLTKTRMNILKEVIDLARESDHISYAFADINCSLCVKLTNGLFKFFNTIDDLNNL